jgi:membrane protease YdiL (CAAX protease family)
LHSKPPRQSDGRNDDRSKKPARRILVTSSDSIPGAESPAPAWHTAALIALIVAVAIAGSVLTALGGTPSVPATPPARVMTVYAPMLAVQWGLTFYVCRIGRAPGVLSELMGTTWGDARRAAADVGMAVVTAFVIVAVNVAYTHLLGSRPNASLAVMLPQTPAERAAWVVVALSTGFCEEVVYRGYLRAALSRWFHSVTLGVIAQSVLFGMAHLDQGPRAAVPIAFYGLLLGALRRFRGSLLPGIICHVIVDIVGGVWNNL